MATEQAEQRSTGGVRGRILEAALHVLASNPDAGMGDIARAAGVVRRTVYGHFPSRIDLIRSIAQRAVNEIQDVFDAAHETGMTAPQVWTDFIAGMWPLARRYRVLVVLRRSEFGGEIHALLKPIDDRIAALVQQGQTAGSFGRHLPAAVLGQVAFATVFTIFDGGAADTTLTAREAAVTSLLTLGVPTEVASGLADSHPSLTR